MAQLAPANIRQGANHGLGSLEMPDAPLSPQGHNGGPEPILSIEYDDGSIEISLDGRSLFDAPDQGPGGWFENLADKIAPNELSRICEDLLVGIRADESSRSDWIEQRKTGLLLLGLKTEVPNIQGAADAAPVEGMSKVRHPLLLEAVLRFQANARSEMLPTDGPVKIRVDKSDDTTGEDRLADALETDMNHYLTTTASEYYPDTDRMLLMLGFGGLSFKKVYFCALRSRPVSETVDADDLIVSNDATDLKNARRKTHRFYLRPSTLRRMQLLGIYRDINLGDPMPTNLDNLQIEKREQQGINPSQDNPEDRQRETFECYCELDIHGFEHKLHGTPTGLEIPYVVTIDVSSREILSIVRNYDEDTKALPEEREVFVDYTFVPGFGFYPIGLLHILGNTTNALTAAWREMLDNGMYANFPGFLFADQGLRQNTNIFRIPPGGGQPIKTGGMPIQQAVMPLPYNTQHMAALQSLADEIAQTGQRVGGTSEMQVGEGRADAPVGTTLAMIEQAVKVLNSVHKRMHASQAREFQLLKRCFAEHPDVFVDRKTPSKMNWSREMFAQAVQQCDLVPQADPNTASHAQRVMKIMALKQLQAANPSMYDPIAIDKAALQAIGWSNPEQFLAPPSAQAQPPPELQEIQAGIKTAQQEADAKTAEANAKLMLAKAELAKSQSQGLASGTSVTDQARLMDAQTHRAQVQLQAQEMQTEDANRDQDRQAKHDESVIDLAKEIIGHVADAHAAAAEVKPFEREIGVDGDGDGS